MDWEIVKISVCCKILVLTSTYLLSNILQKLLSTIDIISQNCRTLHLYPLNVTVIQTVTQSVQSVSARLLIYCELLYRQRRTKNWMSLTVLNICACTSNTFCEHKVQVMKVNTRGMPQLNILWTQNSVKHNTGMRHITKFRSTTDCICDSGPY